ncbi:MAG TPA: SGNH/GDSL hydrolase family protein [Clostridiales bacterium]|nr:SGNH/GDSL hydrolase family protein [Clostridiales bacterium]
MSNLIKDNSLVLLQGDSVTDCGRSRTKDTELGGGYANMIAALFSAKYPEKNVRFINRGVSGNRVKDLQTRWKEDCLDLEPDWVSILIGINDCWRKYDSNDPTSVEAYEKGYRDILKRTVNETDARLILCEPFVLPVPEDRKKWREDLDPKIQAVRLLAIEFNAIYVPFDGIFAAASVKREPAFWAADGVHPTSAGHALMAIEWLKAVSA